MAERPTPAAPGAARAGEAAAALQRVEQALAGRFPHKMVPDLTRMTALMDLLGSPQRAYPSIHLTGTNGKTSTARMVDSLLRAFGLRTGRYTSPHLTSVTERISLDGQPLGAEAFAWAYDDIAPYVELVDAQSLAAGGERVTFFEVLTAMGFAAFADAPVDVAVVEVGMGGTWDATNVIDAGVAIVGSVALDHPELGDSPAVIASEKAGIVHPGSTLVLAAQAPDVAEVLHARAAQVGARVVEEGRELQVLERRVALGGQLLTLQGARATYEEIFLPLHGRHQARNALLALAAVEQFLGAGSAAAGAAAADGLDHQLVRDGFAEADSPGRLEQVRSSPAVLLDGAHNPAGARALAEALGEAFRFRRLVGVVGILADKDVRGVLEALEPVLDALVVTTVDSPRALPLDELADEAAALFGADRVRAVPGLANALDAAVALADDDADDGDLSGGGVLVTGSIVLVGAARRLLAR